MALVMLQTIFQDAFPAYEQRHALPAPRPHRRACYHARRREAREHVRRSPQKTIQRRGVLQEPEDVVEIYARPSGGAYQETRRVARGASLTATAVPALTLDADGVLG